VPRQPPLLVNILSFTLSFCINYFTYPHCQEYTISHSSSLLASFRPLRLAMPTYFCQQ
jgi:hypothetical protein